MQIAAAPDFRDLVHDSSTVVPRAKVDSATLGEPGEQFWRVRSVNVAGAIGPWSESERFELREAGVLDWLVPRPGTVGR